MKLATEQAKIAHLLRRFGLGASEAEMDFYGKNGLRGAIDLLLNEDKRAAGPIPEPESFERQTGNLRPQGVRAWWMYRLLTTHHPLEEKMTLFWHDHFATAFSKVNSGPLMLQQNEVLREHAVGNFRELLGAASKDPAMLYWLDGQYNIAGKPNENFAREVMELFTLGVGHYTEKDVQEAARAFTGWTFTANARRNTANAPRRSRFIFRSDLHDGGTKTVLGKTGPFGGDDVLDILCDHPQTARYITLKLWEWFVYPNPSAAIVDRYATLFRRSGLEVKALLRAIMESPEFYSDQAFRAVYKNPIDFCTATLRQLGVGNSARGTADLGERLRTLAPYLTSTKSMGMEILNPPDVNGWETGAGWISSATMVVRIQWADKLFGASTGQRGGATLRYPAARLFDSPRPEDAVQKLVSIFDAPLPANRIAALNAAAREASGGTVSAQNASEVARQVTRLIFGSPEFQFA